MHWHASNAMALDLLAERLGKNLKQLRQARALTQQQIAKLAGIPRATWSHLESGEGNPTLSVLTRVAEALQVRLEELIATPRAALAHFPKGTLPLKMRGMVQIHKLLPDPLPGMDIDRLELPPRSKMIGVPHTPGTREYLTCERGSIVLIAAGERVTVEAGDVAAFRGDQRHSYENPGAATAIGYSVVVMAAGIY
jgi:XRE family transcriptional regulator, regulator of sulfur utilization